LFFEKGPEAVGKALSESGVEEKLMWRVVKMINNQAVNTLIPFLSEFVPPEDLPYVEAYVEL
jgi:hypothetical protein